MLRKFKSKLTAKVLGRNGRNWAVAPAAPVAPAPVAPAPAPAASHEPRSKPSASLSFCNSRSRCRAIPQCQNILRILVNVGDTVAENQPLMILEAMKMENEIVASKQGVVSESSCISLSQLTQVMLLSPSTNIIIKGDGAVETLIQGITTINISQVFMMVIGGLLMYLGEGHEPTLLVLNGLRDDSGLTSQVQGLDQTVGNITQHGVLDIYSSVPGLRLNFPLLSSLGLGL